MLSFFPLLSLVIDQTQRISVYNIKEKNKICKIVLRTEEERFQITNMTSLLIDNNQDYIVFVAEKDKSDNINYTVLDLINFQSNSDKSVMKEYLKTEPFNYNRSILKDSVVGGKNSYISFLRIKDLILKCYHQFGFHIKKGLSIKKLMMRYDSKSLPMSDDLKGSVMGKMFLNNLTQGLSKPKKKSKTKKKELISVKEKEEDTKKNTSKLEEEMYLISFN